MILACEKWREMNLTIGMMLTIGWEREIELITRLC